MFGLVAVAVEDNILELVVEVKLLVQVVMRKQLLIYQVYQLYI